jgi:hypothetical protein
VQSHGGTLLQCPQTVSSVVTKGPHSGWLMKQGHCVMNMKRRFMKLTADSMLVYYEDDGCNTEKGRCKISQYQIVFNNGQVGIHLKKRADQIRSNSGHDTYYFVAKDSDEARVWVAAMISHGASLA